MSDIKIGSYIVGDWIAFYDNNRLAFDRVEFVENVYGGVVTLCTTTHGKIDSRCVIDVRRMPPPSLNPRLSRTWDNNDNVQLCADSND